MKRILIVNLLFIYLALVGCASAGKMRQCQDDLARVDNDLVTLKAQVKQLNDTLNRKLKTLDDIQFEMGVVQRELFKLRDGEEKALPDAELTKLIDKLKNNNVDLKKISQEFQKHSKAGLAALLYALKEPNLVFRRRVETVMGYMPAKDMVPILNKALREPSVRISAVHVLGNLDDALAIPTLAEHLRNEDPDFRLAIAEALVKLKDKRGLPCLIEYLESNNQAHRALAFDRLVKTTGQTFGYKHYAPESERLEAVRKWETWWLRQGDAFEFSRRDK